MACVRWTRVGWAWRWLLRRISFIYSILEISVKCFKTKGKQYIT